MILGLRMATIWSEDLNNLLPFYRDTLGLKVGIEGDGFVAFGDLATPSLALGTHSDLHGVTKSITFPATIEVGPEQVMARAEFAIKRFDFNIEYKGKADDLIRDDVVIKFDLVAMPAG